MWGCCIPGSGDSIANHIASCRCIWRGCRSWAWPCCPASGSGASRPAAASGELRRRLGPCLTKLDQLDSPVARELACQEHDRGRQRLRKCAVKVRHMLRIWVAGGDICTSAWGPIGALPSRRGCAPHPTATSTRWVHLSRPAWRMDLLTLLLSCGQACAVGCICCHTGAQACQTERRVLGPSQEWWLQRQEGTYCCNAGARVGAKPEAPAGAAELGAALALGRPLHAARGGGLECRWRGAIPASAPENSCLALTLQAS